MAATVRRATRVVVSGGANDAIARHVKPRRIASFGMMQAGNKAHGALTGAAVADGEALRGHRTRAAMERRARDAARFPCDSTPFPSPRPGRTRRLPGVPPQQGNPGIERGRASGSEVQIAGLRVLPEAVCRRVPAQAGPACA